MGKSIIPSPVSICQLGEDLGRSRKVPVFLVVLPEQVEEVPVLSGSQLVCTVSEVALQVWCVRLQQLI